MSEEDTEPSVRVGGTYRIDRRPSSLSRRTTDDRKMYCCVLSRTKCLMCRLVQCRDGLDPSIEFCCPFRMAWRRKTTETERNGNKGNGPMASTQRQEGSDEETLCEEKAIWIEVLPLRIIFTARRCSRTNSGGPSTHYLLMTIRQMPWPSSSSFEFQWQWSPRHSGSQTDNSNTNHNITWSGPGDPPTVNWTMTSRQMATSNSNCIILSVPPVPSLSSPHSRTKRTRR